MEFCPVPEEELHKSSMELDPVVLLCHVSREDAEVVWYDFREQIPNLLFWVLFFFILTFPTSFFCYFRSLFLHLISVLFGISQVQGWL